MGLKAKTSLVFIVFSTLLLSIDYMAVEWIVLHWCDNAVQ
jgi:hypothetical protein